MQRRDPTQQTFLELSRYDGREDCVETIVRRYPIRQIEKLREPVAFRSAELGDGDEIVRPANHRADGNHDDVDQRVGDLTGTGIGEFIEVILYPGRGDLGQTSQRLPS